jgi:hypothetical protein
MQGERMLIRATSRWGGFHWRVRSRVPLRVLPQWLTVVLMGRVASMRNLLLGREGDEHAFADPHEGHGAGVPPWLRGRWMLAKDDLLSGRVGRFPEWFFERATLAQRAELHLCGFRSLDLRLTRGQAADLLGLLQPPQPEPLRVLRFFNQPLSEQSETKARHEAALLLTDPANRQRWKTRPATDIQLEWFRFFGKERPAHLTYEEAKRLMGLQRQELRRKDRPRLNEWDAYKAILERFSDEQWCAAHHMSPPPISAVRASLRRLRGAGQSLSALQRKPILVANELMHHQRGQVHCVDGDTPTAARQVRNSAATRMIAA